MIALRQKTILHLLPGALILCVFYLEGCSTSEEILFSQGREELDQKQYAQAYDSFTRYLEIEPRSTGGYYNRALALVGLDKLQSALDDLDEAARLGPTSTGALWMSFRIRSVLREAARGDTSVTPAMRPLKEGLESVLTVYMMRGLDKILEIDPEDFWALNERGRMKYEQGKYDSALADYDAAMALCASCTWLMYNKALALRASWRTREALAVLDNLIDADSLDGEAWLLMGECKFALGQRREACEAFWRSMRLGIPEAEERYDTLCR